jgi:glycosyltransferase involved in cell wall biosynthesis
MATLQINYLCLQATKQGQASYTHVHEIISGLRGLGYQVNLFEPQNRDLRAGGSAFRRLWGFIGAQRRLWQHIRGCQLLYVRSHFAAFPTVLLAKMKGIPVILELNGPLADLYISWPWTRYLRGVFDWLGLRQLRMADAVITVTSQLRDWVVGLLGPHAGNVYVVPNGANTELFMPAEAGVSPVSQPYVVFFGAMTSWQGIDAILEAVHDPAWPKEVCLVFIGEGAEEDKIKRVAESCPRVKYLGVLPYREMPLYVAHALAGLSVQNNMGGRSETGLYPLKVFETMACGVPVIVTDWPGQSDLVRSCNCGVVIASDDPSELAQAVSLLHSEPSMAAKLGGNGRRCLEAQHSWKARAYQTHEIILSLNAQDE